MKKLQCNISLDLDNQWAYMKTHGDAGWEKYPSYLDRFVPYVLDLFDELDIKATFFVVGQDAARDENKEEIKKIADRGHDIANHSFSHDPYFKWYSDREIEQEIRTTEDHLFGITGKKPVGFRGPGFTWSPSLLNILAQNDYLYDATIFPTFLGPLARAFYFRTTSLSDADKGKLDGLYGDFSNGFRSLRPWYWKLAAGKKLLEIPVSTMPFFRTPFHMTWLIYLNSFSQRLTRLYLDSVIHSCRLTNTDLSFLLHPLDIIGKDQVPELAYFPGMEAASQTKSDFFRATITKIKNHFELSSLEEHARQVVHHGDLPVVDLIPSQTMAVGAKHSPQRFSLVSMNHAKNASPILKT